MQNALWNALGEVAEIIAREHVRQVRARICVLQQVIDLCHLLRKSFIRDFLSKKRKG